MEAPDHTLPNTVMFTIATGGYVPFVLNLEASLEQIGMGRQLLVYALDDKAQQELSVSGVRSVRYPTERCRYWSDYGTPEFGRIASYKYAVGCAVLKSGKNALFVDGDVVFLRNPMSYLREIVRETSADLAVQFESPKNVYNTGFWFATSHPPVIELFSEVQKSLLAQTFSCDQVCFNAHLGLATGIRICALDPDLFACGNRFIEDSAEFAGRSNNRLPVDAAYVLHFNYVVGKEAKVSAMRKYGVVFYPGLATHSHPQQPVLSRLMQKEWWAALGRPVWHFWHSVLQRVLVHSQLTLGRLEGLCRTLSRMMRGKSTGRIVACPNPVLLSDESSGGVTVLSWSARSLQAVEVRVDAPDGQLFAHSLAGGSKQTGRWLADGMVFYLQDVSSGPGLTPDGTLASVRVRTLAPSRRSRGRYTAR
ncbi:MAG: putative nucleotide-diphospho-sugar transferase [Bryobacteraceae bacterium]|jgi:hypothetical protein